jgi:cytochrome c oxidase assembly protein subunit 15
MHLILACVIFAAALWTAARLRTRTPAEVPPRIRMSAIALLVLTLFQIYLGAIVAGLRAGLIYNTWPLIDGGLVPNTASLLHETPWWRNLFENTLTVQFNHRMVAYAIFVFALLHAVDVARTMRRGPIVAHALALAAAVTLQAALGIATLLHAVPIGLALAHQAMAIVVLSIAVVHAERISARSDPTLVQVPATAR